MTCMAMQPESAAQMRWPAWATLGWATFACLALAAGVHAAAAASVPAAAVLTRTERLAALIPTPGPVELRGDRGEFSLSFNLSTRVDPASAALHLELSNSQALLTPRVAACGPAE